MDTKAKTGIARRSTGHFNRSKEHFEKLKTDTKKTPKRTWLKFFALIFVDVAYMVIGTAFSALTTVVHWLFGFIHDWFMMKIVGNTYIYNVNWEDPRVDDEALKLGPNDHVLTIASAGCNSMHFLISGARVTAVDLNPCQLALCEIKRQAAIDMTFEEFFAVFGENNIDILRSHYKNGLREKLTPEAQKFWDEKLPKLKSFMYSGSSGFLAFILFRVLFPLFGFGWVRKAIEAGVSKEDFLALVRKHEWSLTTIAWLGDSVLMPLAAPLAGVPASQLGLGDDREGNIHTVVERIFLGTDVVHDNYLFAGYVLGKYTRENCPRYLKEEHFPTLKQALKEGKFTLHHMTLADRLRKDALLTNPPTYTAAVMLDHLDWMNDIGVNEELGHLWPLLDDKTGRVLWRSFSHKPHKAPLIWLNAEQVDDGSGDRTGMYWGVWVAEKKNCFTAPMLVSDNLFWTEYKKPTTQELVQTGIKIVSFPVINKVNAIVESITGKSAAPQAGSGSSSTGLETNAHARKIEAFYKSQAGAYDTFRENFLHARQSLAACLPVPARKAVWIDVGAGTARNLEFFPIETLRERFSKIYILDISASLIEVARARVAAAGLSDIVDFILADFTDLSPSGMQELPRAGSVDIVTFSYSLSMIPNKEAALKQAARLLRDNGTIGVADFFGQRDASSAATQGPLMRFLESVYDFGCRIWFKQDGVHLLADEVFGAIEPNVVNQGYTLRFRGSVPLLPVLNPWHGVWIATKTA